METKSHSEKHHGHTHHEKQHHYRKLVWMVVISFAAMYMLMYAMVDKWENVFHNVNQIYMAGLMTGAMLIIEMIVMFKMYPNKRLNISLIVIGVIITLGFYIGIRQQSLVGDKQFIKSMIPHHAAAVLMVKKTTLHDPELKALGDSIIAAQQKEINFMKRKLKELESK